MNPEIEELAQNMKHQKSSYYLKHIKELEGYLFRFKKNLGGNQMNTAQQKEFQELKRNIYQTLASINADIEPEIEN